MGTFMFEPKYNTAKQGLRISGFTGDAIHVRKNNTITCNNIITDPYHPKLYDLAHRDGIQIIPHSYRDFQYHYAGGVTRNVTINNNTIYSGNKLQGIFASDGGHIDLHIHRNIITTDSDHFISISGMFSGTIHENCLNNAELAPVLLMPLRIGGNSDGIFNVWIIHLRLCSFGYQPLKTIIPGRSYQHVRDNRNGNLFRNDKDIYLHNFKYEPFRKAVREREFKPDEIRDLALDFGKEDK